jgi:multisubunit Na+/H+ antiporter MnhF subunit
MIKLSQGSYISLRRMLSSVIFLLFLLQVSFLYLNTRTDSIDSLEFMKLFGPISLLLIFTALSRVGQEIFIRFMVSVLYVHILIALIFLAFNFTSSITYDNRLVLSALGRSPGATAQIFCAALIVYDYYLKDRIYGYNNLKKITKVLFITIVLLTQSRAYYLFLIIYFLINYWSVIRNKLNSFKTYMAIISITVIIYFSRIASSIFERSLGNNLFSGRDHIWNEFFNDYFNRDEIHILFGSDLSRHEITINEISYLTSDVHNTFFDIMNYYGLVPTIIFVCWYLFSSGFFNTKKSFVILAAYFPILMLSAVFKYPFAFYSSLLLLLLPIYFSNIRHSEK